MRVSEKKLIQQALDAIHREDYDQAEKSLRIALDGPEGIEYHKIPEGMSTTVGKL